MKLKDLHLGGVTLASLAKSEFNDILKPYCTIFDKKLLVILNSYIEDIDKANLVDDVKSSIFYSNIILRVAESIKELYINPTTDKSKKLPPRSVTFG